MTMQRLLLLLLLATAAAVLWMPQGVECGPAWTHPWTTALDMQFIDFGYQAMTASQRAFAVQHYRIISLEKCTGTPTEPTIWAEALDIKAASNNSVKVLFYWATDQGGLWCYDALQTLLANPSWWLRDDSGVLLNVTAAVPRIDFEVAAARAWWINVPLNGTLYGNGTIDGVLADTAGYICYPGMSAARCTTFNAAKVAMLHGLQTLLDGTPGQGIVLGNVIDETSPTGNTAEIAAMDGAMAEHLCVFEQVISATGALRTDKVLAQIALILATAALNKTVIVGTWPGLLVEPFTADGWPSWPQNTQPTNNSGWRQALLAKHNAALALYLTVAAPNVWMMYEGWYNGFSQGAIPCPSDPAACAAPDTADWYPDLFKPLGAPLGPAVRNGRTFTRSFQHARSFVDLDDFSRTNVTFLS